MNLKLLLKKKKMKTEKTPEPAPLAEEAGHFRKPGDLRCGTPEVCSLSPLCGPPVGRARAASSPSVAARTVTGTVTTTTSTWVLVEPRTVYAVAPGVQGSSGAPSPSPHVSRRDAGYPPHDLTLRHSPYQTKPICDVINRSDSKNI